MTRGKELLVGAVIILATAVAVLGTLWLQGTNFGRPLIPVQVLLESVAQLQEGNVVTYRGVRIGRVDAIAVEPGGSGVRVTLLLEQEVSLPLDAGVILGPESLFGDWQAEIVSRSSFPSFPFYDVPLNTPEGVTVLGGYALPELSRLTASAEQIALNVAELTDRLELAFNQETADQLARAIGNIGAITEEVRLLVQQQGQVAASITASADSALVEIETAAEAARRSFERVDGIMSDAQLDSIVADLGSAADGMRVLTATLTAPDGRLSSTLAGADSVFGRLDRMTAQIEAGEGSLGRLFADTTLAVRASDVLLQLELLLEDFRENPHRYVRLSIF